MAFIERVIESVSPAWALRRMAQRQLLEHARDFYSAGGGGGGHYRGSWPGRLDTAWPRQLGITGQTWQDRYELRSMRDRSRDLDRNNPIAEGMLNRLRDNVVGEGFTLQVKTDQTAFNGEVEERFVEFMDEADVRGMVPGDEMQRQLYRGHERDGDGGLVLVSKGGIPKLQLIEADQIYQPDGQALTPTFVDGVEMDRAGKPIRFHVLDCPQGGQRVFTPVAAKNFVFFPRFKRYGNNIVRGEPCFSTTYELFDHLNRYVDAVTVAAWMAAIFGLIFKGPTGAAELNNLPLTADGMQKAFTIENGQVRWIGGKDSVVQVQAQQPMAQTPEFVAVLLRLIGVPMDMPLELVLLDFSRVNYSSARAAFLQFYQAMIPKQKYFRIKVMNRIYRWWLELMIATEAFTTAVPANPTLYRHHFMPRGWQWVDPVREAQAALLEISAGVNSPQRVAARLGRDYDQILAEIAADAAARKLAKLPINASSLTREAIGQAMEAASAAEASGTDDDETEPDDDPA